MIIALARRARGIGVLLGAVALASCSPEKLLERIAPAESRQFVRSLLDTLASAPPGEISRHFTARLADQPGLADSILSVQRQFAVLGNVDSAKFLGGTVFIPSDSSAVVRALTFEVFGERGFARVHVRLTEDDTLRHVDGLRIEQLPAPLAAIHGFRENMGLMQVIVLIVTLAVIGFSLWAAVRVARTPMPWRWVWVLVALVGVGQFGVNWTTGEFISRTVSVQLLGASMFRHQLLGPWFVTFSFPLGAIVAMRQRSRALASSRGEPMTSQPSDSPAAA